MTTALDRFYRAIFRVDQGVSVAGNWTNVNLTPLIKGITQAASDMGQRWVHTSTNLLLGLDREGILKVHQRLPKDSFYLSILDLSRGDGASVNLRTPGVLSGFLSESKVSENRDGRFILIEPLLLNWWRPLILLEMVPHEEYVLEMVPHEEYVENGFYQPLVDDGKAINIGFYRALPDPLVLTGFLKSPLNIVKMETKDFNPDQGLSYWPREAKLVASPFELWVQGEVSSWESLILELMNTLYYLDSPLPRVPFEKSFSEEVYQEGSALFDALSSLLFLKSLLERGRGRDVSKHQAGPETLLWALKDHLALSSPARGGYIVADITGLFFLLKRISISGALNGTSNGGIPRSKEEVFLHFLRNRLPITRPVSQKVSLQTIALKGRAREGRKEIVLANVYWWNVPGGGGVEGIVEAISLS